MSMLHAQMATFHAQGGGVPAGNITLDIDLFENAQSFGTDESSFGIEILTNGQYNFSAEGSSSFFWQSVDFGVEWIDDGGASADQFEARLVALNIGSLDNPTFVGWSGFDEWLPIDQRLALTDINFDPAFSSHSGIWDIEIREITDTGNLVSGNCQMSATNDF